MMTPAERALLIELAFAIKSMALPDALRSIDLKLHALEHESVPPANKSYQGRIAEWRILMGDRGLYVEGWFVDHTTLHNTRGHTSPIVSLQADGGLETRNSRYQLVGPPTQRG